MTAQQARLFEPLIAVHVAAAMLAVLLGAVVLARQKGTPVHRGMGRVWACAMTLTALTSLFMPGTVWAVDTPIGRYGAIHLLSLLTLVTLVRDSGDPHRAGGGAPCLDDLAVCEPADRRRFHAHAHTHPGCVAARLVSR